MPRMRNLLWSIIALCAVGCCPEQWRPGVRLANGSTFEVLRDDPGLVYSMRGFERVSQAELKPTSLFHVLVLLPDVKMYGSGSGITISCLRATETLHWLVGDYKNPPVPEMRRELALLYDGAEMTLTIAQDEFDLSQGNVIIVSVDDNWQPRSRQLHGTLSEPAELSEVLQFIKVASPQGEFDMFHLYSDKGD